MRRRLLALGAGLLVVGAGLGAWWPLGEPTRGGPAIAATGDVPIVYSRCARAEREAPVTATVSVNGRPTRITKTLRHTDVLDVLPDVTQFFSGFTTPCDLILRDAAGAERVLYDCASHSSETASCAALDAAVSFDARAIAFAVFRGPVERRTLQIPPQFFHPAAKGDDTVNVRLPNAFLAAREAQLHLVDVTTGAVRALPHPPGAFESGPAWLSNGRLAFTSTRSGQFSTPIGRTQRPASQVFTMDPDGRNVEKASYHALAGEQHPLQLVDGRVALSSWQLFGMLPYRQDNGSPGGFGTLENYFHVYSQFPDGAQPFPLYGQHTINLGYPGAAPAHFAAHFIGQSSDRRLWVADYYRGNNSGFGEIVGFPLPPDGQEGIGPDARPHIHDVYRPKGFTTLTRWASGFDGFAGPMPGRVRIPTYRDPLAYAGKVSHPAGLPNNALLVTWGVGVCSEIANGELVGNPPFTDGGGGIEAMNALTLLGRDNPGCDAGIYRTSRIPSTSPSDLIPVVNRREYHEILARPVLPYAAIYGVERPSVIPRADRATAGNPDLPPGTPFGVLGASSIILRETRPIAGLSFSGNPLPFALQGTDTVDYRDDELCGVRILATQPSRDGDAERYLTAVGERVVVLGEFPVRKFDGTGRPVLDPTGAPDTSFTVRFPANTPYLMQGVDCLGRTLNTDQTWQHLRPGELKTCNGCHVHGKPGLPFARTAAAAPGFRPVRLGEGTVPLLLGGTPPALEVAQRPGYGMQYEYERDVFPVLQRRCAACHSGPGASAGLVLDRSGVGPGSTYDRLVLDAAQRFVPARRRHPHAFTKPQLTKYVRVLAARGSLLYWKAANQRTDGRTDRSYTAASGPDWEDVDFGPAHPTGITRDELGVLSRWIDTGAAAAPGFLQDTTPPALNLTAVVDGAALTRLQVGTVDVPSGIDEESLQVCLAAAAGPCASVLPARAAPHGTVTIVLPRPLNDPDLEIRARVRDRAGNETAERRTVRWLIDNAVSVPARVGLGEGRAGARTP